jgi:threonine/homoserine/homoserine lactone efflux protein
MDIFTIISLFFFTAIFGATPGPGSLAILSVSVSKGFKPAFYLSIGEVVGDIIYLSLVVFSMELFVDEITPIIEWVKIFGAAYLLYLGYSQFVAGEINTDGSNIKSTKNLLFSGFLIGGTNPKVIVFHISFLPAFIDLSTLTVATSIEVIIVAFLGVLFGLNIINMLGKPLKKLISNKASAKLVNQISGVVMGLVGVALLIL